MTKDKILKFLAEENIALPPGISGKFYREYQDTKHSENRLKFWLSLDQWTRTEAAFIFLDIQPDTVKFDSVGVLERYKSFSGNFDIEQDLDDSGFPIAVGVDSGGFEEYLTKQQLTMIYTLDSMASDNLKLLSRYEIATPEQWISLAQEKKIPIPWLKWATDYGLCKSKDDEDSSSDKYDGLSDEEMFDLAYGLETRLKPIKNQKQLSTRTKNNYLKLIFALANGIVGFNPKKPHEAASLIIKETGIENLSAETIANYISEAYQLESKNRD